MCHNNVCICHFFSHHSLNQDQVWEQVASLSDQVDLKATNGLKSNGVFPGAYAQRDISPCL